MAKKFDTTLTQMKTATDYFWAMFTKSFSNIKWANTIFLENLFMLNYLHQIHQNKIYLNKPKNLTNQLFNRNLYSKLDF